MKNFKQILLAASLVLFASCAKDNGNYEYTNEPNAITISKEMSVNQHNQSLSAFNFVAGEQIRIPALYTINTTDITESDLSFEWILGGETVGTGSELVLDPMAPASYTGTLVITEKKFGMSYSTYFVFRVSTLYSDGFAVLSDNGTECKLGYLTQDNDTYEYVFTPDVYGVVNPGAKLSSGKKKLQYHHLDEANGLAFGLNIFQNDDDGPIDLNPVEMSLYGKFKDNFLTEVPSGFLDISFKQAGADNHRNVYAVSDEGLLYVRSDYKYNGATVPFAGKFSSSYVMDKPYKLSWMLNTSGLSTMILGCDFDLAYDELNHRFVRLSEEQILPFTMDYYTNGANEPFMPGDPVGDGSELVFIGPENTEGYELVKTIGCGWDAAAWDTGSNYVTIVSFLKKTGGSADDIYIWAFDYYDGGGAFYDVDLRLFSKWDQPEIPIDPETMVIRNNIGAMSGPVFFFTSKDNMDLYYYNTLTNTVRKVYTSESKITAYRSGTVGDMMAAFGMEVKYLDVMVVGDENGGITVLNMDANAIATGDADVIKEIETSDGAITEIEFMPNNWTSY